MSSNPTALSPADVRAQRQLDALLAREGLRRDDGLDYTCGVFDDDGRLIATGSCRGNTLRCLAVDSARQGEGLLDRIVAHLLEVQFARGNRHVFLYTKASAAHFFAGLGFYEVARVPGQLVFMENRRHGFANYCAALEHAPEGRTAAVVMNANPFTLGHRHLLEVAAKDNDWVHLFLLSEDAGPIPFAVRKRLVLAGTADLGNVIYHDSGAYIISSATFPTYFLKGDDDAVRAQAVLDLTVFGAIARALDITSRYVGEEPFSRVTALYNEIMTARLPLLGVECRVFPRLAVNGRTVSASAVRQAIHDGALDSVADMLPETTLNYLRSPEAAPIFAAIRAEKDVQHH